METASPAIFLDRDGVLLRDTGLVTSIQQVEILPGVPTALRRLRRAGFLLVVVTNQSVVARGLLTEPQVRELHRRIEQQILSAGGPRLDGFYYCPHHPQADLPQYRLACDCRKPASGLLTRAASDLKLNLAQSFMIGDRMTDIAAGWGAGCRTVWVQTGRHEDPPIETVQPVNPALSPDQICADLPAAAEWILQGRREAMPAPR